MSKREDIIKNLEEHLKQGRLWLTATEVKGVGLNFTSVRRWAMQGLIRVKPKGAFYAMYSVEDLLDIVKAGGLWRWLKLKREQRRLNEN